MSARETYTYRAARPDGVEEGGRIEAASRDEALLLLTTRELFPIEVRLYDLPAGRRNSIPPEELAVGLRILASLLESGLPISRVLLAMDEFAPPAWRRVLPGVREAIREGSSLSAALEGTPGGVPPLVLGLIRAGEAGTGLGAAVLRAADLMERAAATRAEIRNALTYPFILAVAGTGSLALLVGVVLPRFAGILSDMGQTLPRGAQWVLASAAVARATAIPLLIGCLVAFAIWRNWTITPTGRVRWHGMLLSLPLVNRIRLSAATARVSAAMAGLLENGVPMGTTLRYAAEAAGDAALRGRLLSAREAVVGGAQLSRALADCAAMPPGAVRLVRAGEEAGDLPGLLTRVAAIEDEAARRQVRRAVQLIEPAMILIFGAAVALVAAVLLQAVYSVRPGL